MSLDWEPENRHVDALDEIHGYYTWLCLVALFFGVLIGVVLGAGR